MRWGTSETQDSLSSGNHNCYKCRRMRSLVFHPPFSKKKNTTWKVMDDSSNCVTYNNILCRRLRKHPCFWETGFSIIFLDAETIRMRVGHGKWKKEREGENKEGRKQAMKEIKNMNLLDLCKVFPKGKKRKRNGTFQRLV